MTSGTIRDDLRDIAVVAQVVAGTAVRDTARRIAAIVGLEGALDANYAGVVGDGDGAAGTA